MSHVKETYSPWVPKAPIDDTYPMAYKFILINTIEDLRKVLDNNSQVMRI